MYAQTNEEIIINIVIVYICASHIERQRSSGAKYIYVESDNISINTINNRIHLIDVRLKQQRHYY